MSDLIFTSVCTDGGHGPRSYTNIDAARLDADARNQKAIRLGIKARYAAQEVPTHLGEVKPVDKFPGLPLT